MKKMSPTRGPAHPRSSLRNFEHVLHNQAREDFGQVRAPLKMEHDLARTWRKERRGRIHTRLPNSYGLVFADDLQRNASEAET
jgi:hypothetical protein